MTVNDLHMIALRAHLEGQEHAVQRAYEQLTGPHAMDGLAELVYAAFLIAARRKFSPTWNRAQVVLFVARLRALFSKEPELLDPLTAEYELRRVLGEDIPTSPDTGAGATARLILLDALIQSLNLDDKEIWSLLIEARENAMQYSKHSLD